MAISRVAGTEILRSAHFEHVNGTAQRDLIVGEQHHIYTILSIIIHADTVAAVTDTIQIVLLGYDSFGGTSAQDIRILRKVLPDDETFCWNERISFSGFEPTNFSGPMDDATKQDAIADQGSGVAQKLKFAASNASSYYDIFISFIDQNNA